MTTSGNTWALVLARGDGNRLRSLTTRPGVSAVPKQFCSLHGGQTLLEDALDRAAAFTSQTYIATIVAHQHQQWWSDIDSVGRLSASNVIVQPRNCGAGIGVLYALLHITARDPHAHVALLPADHHVSDESILHESLMCAARLAQRDPTRAIVLGLEPDAPDPDLGYIVPERRTRSAAALSPDSLKNQTGAVQAN